MFEHQQRLLPTTGILQGGHQLSPSIRAGVTDRIKPANPFMWLLAHPSGHQRICQVLLWLSLQWIQSDKASSYLTHNIQFGRNLAVEAANRRPSFSVKAVSRLVGESPGQCGGLIQSLKPLIMGECRHTRASVRFFILLKWPGFQERSLITEITI